VPRVKYVKKSIENLATSKITGGR